MRKFKNLDCILLIDDDPATNFLNQLLLRDFTLDAHVQVTESGFQALEYLTCTGRYAAETKFPQPGIILLDINMPGMNGWEFMEEYKRLPENQKGGIVLAMLTTSFNPEDRERASIISEIDDFISKPLTPKSMERILNNHYSEITGLR